VALFCGLSLCRVKMARNVQTIANNGRWIETGFKHGSQPCGQSRKWPRFFHGQKHAINNHLNFYLLLYFYALPLNERALVIVIMYRHIYCSKRPKDLHKRNPNWLCLSVFPWGTLFYALSFFWLTHSNWMRGGGFGQRGIGEKELELRWF
jgi:hypothetical protein